MATIKTPTNTAVANLKKLAGKPFFRLKSPFISSFVKQICTQIDKSDYEGTEYLKKFAGIKLTKCSNKEFCLVYKCLEMFNYLKENEKNRENISFKKDFPTESYFLESIPDEAEKTQKTKIHTLKSAVLSANMKVNWDESINWFINILKGKKFDGIVDEIKEESDIAEGNMSSIEGTELIADRLNKSNNKNNSKKQLRGTDKAASKNLPNSVQKKRSANNTHTDSNKLNPPPLFKEQIGGK